MSKPTREEFCKAFDVAAYGPGWRALSEFIYGHIYGTPEAPADTRSKWQSHDTVDGPCECGAWHKPAAQPAPVEVVTTDEHDGRTAYFWAREAKALRIVSDGNAEIAKHFKGERDRLKADLAVAIDRHEQKFGEMTRFRDEWERKCEAAIARAEKAEADLAAANVRGDELRIERNTVLARADRAESALAAKTAECEGLAKERDNAIAELRGFKRWITGDEHDRLLAAAVEAEREALHGAHAELLPLITRMAKGRAKYPSGCTALSLIDEAGEFAHAINKREDLDRVRDELLDVAAVAMRLYCGEIDTESTLEGLQSGG